MAKAFSEKEKEIIRDRLKEGAIECLQLYGVRKTTVDELVKRAGISKGAFYLFYQTKEVLFFEVMADFQARLQNALLSSAHSLKGRFAPDDLVSLLFNLMKEVDGSFMMTLFQNGDIEYLQRKLPEEILASHHLDDDLLFSKLCDSLPLNLPKSEIELFSASLRAIAITMAAKKAIGEVYYDQVLRVLLTGVVEQLYKRQQP